MSDIKLLKEQIKMDMHDYLSTADCDFKLEDLVFEFYSRGVLDGAYQPAISNLFPEELNAKNS